MPFPENKYINQVYILQILDVATSNSVYSYIVAASERTDLPGWVRRETIYQLRMPLVIIIESLYIDLSLEILFAMVVMTASHTL